MKKILFFILLLIISISIVNAENTFYLGDKVSDMYIESIKGDEMHNGAPFLLHRNDGKIVYCLNPFKMMNTENKYESYDYNNKIFNLSDEQLNKLNIISYFGYGYKNHTDIKWYGITQYLIWKNLNMDDIYFTDSYHGNKVDKYKDEVKELETLVNNYYKLPSFANKTYSYFINSENMLYDSNNVLGEYIIKEANIDVSFKDQGLYINPKADGEYIIKFVKKSPIENQFVLYNLYDSQSLIYPGKIADIEFELKIEVKSGSVTVNINNEELIDHLKGKKIDLFEGPPLYKTLTLDENGKTYLDKLPYGRYVLKPPKLEGYKTEYYEYVFFIDKQFPNQVININYELIKGNLIINKYYGSKDNYVLDDKAIFEIYKDNSLVKIIKSKDGIINESLEYGSYLIKQIHGEENYDLVDEFKVDIIENKDYQFDLYTELNDDFVLKQESLNEKEKQLLKLENELNKKEEELIELEKKLKEQEQKLIDLENELKKKEEGLIKLENELKEKEVELLGLEKKLKEKEELMHKSEKLKNKNQTLNDLETRVEEQIYKNKTLIVEVPNTYKKNYNKYGALILILIGILIFTIGVKIRKSNK